MAIRFLIFSGIIYLFYILSQNFLNLDYFNITKINISENSKMLQPELTNLTEILYNKNIKKLDLQEIKRILEKDVRVKTAEVDMNKLGEININIEDKGLSYYAVIGKNIYLVDENGIIFGYLNEQRIENLPFIVAGTEEEIKEITKILNSILDKNTRDSISQIYILDDKEIVIILEDGVKFKIDKKINKQKYSIAVQLYLKMSKEKKIDYIDLRFDDYIIKYIGDEKNE
ncbi:cell division protein FtsQ/DivIB [Fusobacterium massiliense]|uniref:cell division protein FtsQ/DivIB n=1 Tax=Fusobacterium massiliense TaxID=1852365 RepID=UPI0028E2F6F3|nr:cell division protein FtsQ/DivIB [Fusobacterium massiliense]